MKSPSIWLIVPAIYFLLGASWNDMRTDEGFFDFIRIGVTGLTAYMAVYAYQRKIIHLAWILGGIAVIFNPVFKVHLYQDSWPAIDFIAAIGIGYGWWMLWRDDGGKLADIGRRIQPLVPFLKKAGVILVWIGFLIFITAAGVAGKSIVKGLLADKSASIPKKQNESKDGEWVDVPFCLDKVAIKNAIKDNSVKIHYNKTNGRYLFAEVPYNGQMSPVKEGTLGECLAEIYIEGKIAPIK